jgi:hypothetical protein
MTSPQFIDFVEHKLVEVGVKKVVPNSDTLAETYRLFIRGREVEKLVKCELAKLNDHAVSVPPDLEMRVSLYLAEHPEARWDAAVATLTEGRQ